jgi:tetratricopeptide (TPR) repeat protein
LSELSVLEKALSTGDFAKQKEPLEEILKQVGSLHLRSLEDLDFNTRGRLLTTLLRVARQKKPPAPSAAASPPSEPAPAPAETAADASAAPADETPTASPDAPQPQQAATNAEVAATAQAGTSGEGQLNASSAESAAGAAEPPPMQGLPSAPAPAPRPLSPEELKLAAYTDVMFLVGSVWKAAGDQQRAEVAFAASGRKPLERRRPSVEAAPASRDWREEARLLEGRKRTRDAARLHERHESHAEAARLYEAGGDLKNGLRCLLAAKDLLAARRLLKQMKPDQFLPIIEKAGAYELLMEHYVDVGDLENVAKLYERARQFDQAAIAWEKSGKLAAARKAYERSKDSANAERVRQLEVTKLIERGDRLGAALLLIAAGKQEEAVQTLISLPAAKAFRFLQKVKLDAQALELARKEIARAEAENRPAAGARWLELLGDVPAAAEAWERAQRKDRALALYEQSGNWQRAAQLAESLGQRDKAVELYHRAGDKASAERAAAMPAQVAAPPPSDAPVALEGEGEEG